MIIIILIAIVIIDFVLINKRNTFYLLKMFKLLVWLYLIKLHAQINIS